MTTQALPTQQRRRGRVLENWNPEDPDFWAREGSKVANRNLLASIFSEHLGFSIWTLWSVLVLFMTPENGFTIDVAAKFLLTSVIALVGAVMRVPYTLAVPRFGGRNWTVSNTFILLVPTAAAAYLITQPGSPYWAFLLAGIVAGFGGANFSSSMTNINQFFPERRKGWALGLNAGGGNIGVAAIQVVGLVVIAVFGTAHPEYLPYFYLPLVLLAALVAIRYMDNIAGTKADARKQFAVMKDKHSWVMSFLYIGTFGSFIGYSFAFGLVLQNQFNRTPVEAMAVTFLGPLLGSLSRPVGGWLSDKIGGAKVTCWNFGAMIAGVGVILLASAQDSLGVFTTGFIVLFVLTGVGNGSTYKMIPSIFAAQAQDRIAAGSDPEDARKWARLNSGSLIGLCGAIGAVGGVLINLAFRQSFLSVGSGSPAFVAFLIFYAVCMVTTFAVYLRRPA
ncbi:MAG: MFS transporter [Streptosporangiales bacterium]|nr:MFS transporter [Streptosporangiales bacterium]